MRSASTTTADNRNGFNLNQQSIANKAQEAMITLLDSKGLEANMCQEKTPDRFDIDYSFEEELESL